MEYRTLGEQYAEYLNLHALQTLRIIGRKFGVPQSASLKKEPLIERLVKVLTGEVAPVPPTNRGAPVKQTYVDPEILKKLEEIRCSAEEKLVLEVQSSAPVYAGYGACVYCGYLEITQNGYGFLRGCKNCSDVLVDEKAISAYRLRQGDKVSCYVSETAKETRLSELLTVNGLPVGRYEDRMNFEELSAHYPTNRIALGESGDVSLRLVDLFAPIGKGQRVLLLSGSESEREYFLKKISVAAMKTEEFSVLAFLVGVAPEEVTDYQSCVRGVEIFSSTFEETRGEQIRKAELVLSHAKRLVEGGRDVFLVLNSLDAISRAYETKEDETGALRFFGAARNAKGWGSLTIVASLNREEEKFLGTENAKIYLSDGMIDVFRSETKKEELLLTAEEQAFTRAIRLSGKSEEEKLLSAMERTANNTILVKQYQKGR